MKHRSHFDKSESLDAGDLINLTPLLDVLFVVLIMFILVAPLLDIDRIDLATTHTHKEHVSSRNQTKAIKIYLHSDNSIWLDAHNLSFSELKLTLRELKEIYPEETPELYPDKNVSFGTYQTVKNILEETGFQQLDIFLKNE